MCDPVTATAVVVGGYAAKELLDDGGGGGGQAAPAAPAEPQVDPAEAERQRQAEEARKAEERAAAERAAEAERQRVAEEQRVSRINTGRTKIDDAFAPFDSSFYNNVSQSYNDFASDDLNQQYQTQLSGLISALTRSGGLNTAARSRGIDALRDQYDTARSQIGTKGQEYANSIQSSVSSAKDALYGQNAGDPGLDTIGSSATAKASELQATPKFSPIAQLMIDPTQFMASRPGTVATGSGGGSKTPALFSANRQARGGGYTVV